MATKSAMTRLFQGQWRYASPLCGSTTIPKHLVPNDLIVNSSLGYVTIGSPNTTVEPTTPYCRQVTRSVLITKSPDMARFWCNDDAPNKFPTIGSPRLRRYRWRGR